MTASALLCGATLDRALALSGVAPMLVACSGGGDSTALLHLLCERVGPRSLIAVTIDHGLRATSADEAEQTKREAEALGVSARVHRLAWAGGVSTAQRTTREARYSALCDIARESSARVIFVAHTRDDQAETVLMRAAAGSLWRGLAGMRAIAPAPLWPEGRGLVVVRPLLGAHREALRAFLRARNVSWIEDPSNENRAFARVRAREGLAGLGDAGVDAMRFARIAERIAPLAARLDDEAGAFIDAHARFDGPCIHAAREAWPTSAELARRVLAVLIAAAAGAPREPRAEALARLEAALKQPDFPGASLGGALVRAQSGGVMFRRDPGAVAGRAGCAPLAPLALPKGEEVIWDGRLALTGLEAGWTARAQTDAPIFARAQALLTLEEAARAGVVRPAWRLKERARHALYVHSALTEPV